MAVKFLTDSGSGSLVDAIEAIDYATKMDVDLMSNSWGGGGYTQALFDSIKAASDKGILFVAAAGNSTSNNDVRANYPSNYATENMIAVAAITHQDQLASFSSYGKRTVHVSAPGRNVLSSTPNNGYSVFSGTSMATPHVTAAVALYAAKNYPTSTNQAASQVIKKAIINNTIATPSLSGKTSTGGRLNVGVVGFY